MAGNAGIAGAVGGDALVALGAFARETWERRKGAGRRLTQAQQDLDSIAVSIDAEDYALQLEQALQQTERAFWEAVDRVRRADRDVVEVL